MELYTPGEIARAAGVSEAEVRVALGVRGGDTFVPHDAAVRVGRRLVEYARAIANGQRRQAQLFSPPPGSHIERHPFIPLALSSTLHIGVAVVLILAGLNLAPHAAMLQPEDPPDLVQLVFLASPGPGGGGGGGGRLEKAPPPKAMREGTRRISSPVPETRQPKPIAPAPAPPLKAEPLPVVMAPVVSVPADSRDRIGVAEQTPAQVESAGPGKGGGTGTGDGVGIGSGDGSGIGPGSGGGTGGGPYRPGSGIQPPRLLREVKADYTEDARKRSISGEVVLEIVVRRDGSVGDVKILQGLGGGLNERAIQAVRQWRFAPAQRLGAAVDVIVEVGVEFRLR